MKQMFGKKSPGTTSETAALGWPIFAAVVGLFFAQDSAGLGLWACFWMLFSICYVLLCIRAQLSFFQNRITAGDPAPKHAPPMKPDAIRCPHCGVPLGNERLPLGQQPCPACGFAINVEEG